MKINVKVKYIFSYEWFRTKTRPDAEAKSNSEWVISRTLFCIIPSPQVPDALPSPIPRNHF